MSQKLLKQLPGFREFKSTWRRLFCRYGDNPFLQRFRPGHFYSPIPDPKFIERHRATLFDVQVDHVPGIELRAAEQLALVKQFAAFREEHGFPVEKTAGQRYYFNNSYFSYADAIQLYSMLRQFRPRRVIEVGSGFSSAVMLDTNDRFFDGRIDFTFIEPYPDRLYSLLNDRDREQHEILVSPVQEIAVEKFRTLEANDILFIDSSHVAKIGTDVLFLLTHALPALRPGVLIHFHDVFWPFEYPEEWLRVGRAWNEDYFLKAFLQFNTHFQIECFNSYLKIHHRAALEQHLPLCLKNCSGSLWIRKVA